MGQRGPPKTPTNMLHMAGSWRAKTRPNEPKIKAKLPYPPKWLNKLPPQVMLDFKCTARQLFNLKIVCDLDAQPLARLAYLRYRFKLAVSELEQACHVEQGQHGSNITAEFKSVDSLAKTIDRMERSFGITPSARASLNTIGTGGEAQKPVGSLEDFRQKTG